jgi:sucrose-phosphate synthase
MKTPKLYLALYSVHGLLRGSHIELGRDADTGGQITYVVELAKALGEREEVGRVDLFTRLIEDPKIDRQYSQALEPLSPKVNIVRLLFGPRRYLRKEALWPHLESLVDQSLHYFRRLKRIPDVIHGHYADAGYAGAMLSYLLEVPFVFTGHSLGREKLRRLQEKGQTRKTIRETYHIDQRIEAEETALNAATFVVASTHQEIEQQYKHYDRYVPERMRVIPPGVDVGRFTPFNVAADATMHALEESVRAKLTPFLREPDKPMILALSRADERKNIPALIRAYAQNPALQAQANLVIVAGNRDDIRSLDKGARTVLEQILLDIDRDDLYGKVAYPKHHSAAEVPVFYRLVGASGGVFVNPALTEPFGLTLLEAAAAGVPIVATHDGGPQDILVNCDNGVLIDPLDTPAIGAALLDVLTDHKRWQSWSANGLRGVRKHYTWHSHVDSYLKTVKQATDIHKPTVTINLKAGRRFTMSHKIFVTDIDNTLIGDAEALQTLLEQTRAAGSKLLFAVATGRRLGSALAVLEEWKVPLPDILITSVGTEIHSGAKLLLDSSWRKHINHRWEPQRVRAEMNRFKGICLQPDIDQREFKSSYFVCDPEQAPDAAEVIKTFRQKRIAANVIYSHGQFIDVLPIRASKGLAVRHLAFRWGLPIENILVTGDSGNDLDMLKGDTLGVVVGNYSEELEVLRGPRNIYFADGHYAHGILEGMRHFKFLDDLHHDALDEEVSD